MNWLRRLLGGTSDMSRIEHAIEEAAKEKSPGWYVVTSIKVHKTNPIDFYVVQLDSTEPPV